MKDKTKKNLDDKLVVSISSLVITITAALCLIPFILVISSSITEEIYLVKNGFQMIPEKISFYAYDVILKSGVMTRAYAITIFVTTVGTALSLIITSGIAYALSLDKLRYKNHINFFVYFTMLFNGGLVPTYLLIAKYLGMKNSIWVLIIPVLVNPWNMFLLRNFFKTVPAALSESATLDGASDLMILTRIILPVSLPAMATIGLFYALGYWNEWFRAMLFIDREAMFPLQYLIMRIIRNIQFADQISDMAGATSSQMSPDNSAKMATAILTIGPIVFVYPFIQKYFVKGLMVGSIKG